MQRYTPHRTMFVLAAFLLIAGIYVPEQGGAQSQCTPESPVRSCVLDIARRCLGVRYRLGGHTPRGFDCSGFVYYVFRKSGIAVPRTATEQYKTGRKIRRERLKPGDLVFFSRRISRPAVQHVGIYTGNDRFIHAPSFGLRVSSASMKDRYWRARYIGAVTFCAAGEETPGESQASVPVSK
ncbi:MAG TPA: C40 family peptidase [Spirochaetota bacterium]|nr:C40 family peptidase [Spirochaetota bacterium]